MELCPGNIDELHHSAGRAGRPEQNIIYIVWNRDAKDYIKARDRSGRLLVSVIEFAEGLGDTPVTDSVLVRVGLDEDVVKQLEYGFYMFINNYIAGHVKEVVQHGVDNDIDVWRKLYKDQLSLVDGKRNIFMTEFMKLDESVNVSGLRHITAEVQRIFDNGE